MDWTHELLRVALGMIFQAAVLHKKNAWCLAEEQWSHPWTSKKYQLPGSFSCWAPFSPHKRTSRQERTVTTPSSSQLLGTGNGRICEVTAASEKWGQGWRQGQAAITAFLPHSSLAAENWQTQLFLFSRSPSPVVLLMPLNRLEPVLPLLVPLRIWSTVLG